jgi:aspartate kinase
MSPGMKLVVQKYGGTSVNGPDRIREVARRVAETRALGHDIVVVVSAMGDSTDRLLTLARQVSERPNRRELDMLLTTGERVAMALLAIALHDRGVDAQSFTGSQTACSPTAPTALRGSSASARTASVRNSEPGVS